MEAPSLLQEEKPPLPVVLPAQEDEDVSHRFPDKAFRKFILERVLEQTLEEPYPIYGRDLEIISTVTEANFKGDENWSYWEVVPVDKIVSMEGIQYFQSLEVRQCNANLLTELDISRNTLLEWVELCRTNLASVDLAGFTNLRFLSVEEEVLVTNLQCEITRSYTSPYKWQQDVPTATQNFIT